jgi:hypothetical protein
MMLTFVFPFTLAFLAAAPTNRAVVIDEHASRAMAARSYPSASSVCYCQLSCFSAPTAGFLSAEKLILDVCPSRVAGVDVWFQTLFEYNEDAPEALFCE